MTDSPVPSPRTDAFSPKSKLSTSVFPPLSEGTYISGRESEFLDMGVEEDEEEGSDNESTAASAADTTITDDPGMTSAITFVDNKH